MSTIYFDGHWHDASSGRVIDVVNPATGKKISEISRGDSVDVNLAVASAINGHKVWSGYSAVERGRVLNKASRLILDKKDEIAAVESSDTGKPLWLAEGDVVALARYFEYYGAAADKHHGQVIPYSKGFNVYSVHEPIGVTGHITPWNYPAQMFGRTVCPSVAAGNAVVLKPSEEACLSSFLIARILQEAGLPNGVLNIVTGYGYEAGDALSKHPALGLITFTGSPVVGKLVQKSSADNHVRCLLELGGKSPQIVFDDADFDKAVSAVVSGFIQNTGQTCSAGARLLVQRSCYEEFIGRLAEELDSISIGMPDSDAKCGPIITRSQFEKVRAWVDRIEEEKIPVIAKLEPRDDVDPNGFFVPAMICGPVEADHDIAQEEIFGPILAVIPFSTEDEAIAYANGTDYGLVAAVWSESSRRLQRMSKKIQAGQVFLNCFGAGGGVELPFGGVKKSGYGREKGFVALDEFTAMKTVVSYFE